MRARALLVAVLLAGPAVLAFFQGGYFPEPRLWAGLAACALLVAAAVVSRRPLPRALPGRLALGGLALLVLWTALSITWAPVSTYAVADADRLLLYLAGFAAAFAALDTRAAVRALEPGIALGAFAAVAYGLSERVLPGIFHIPHDASAFGRLSRPLTYWNAMGTLAALGIVLAARVAGDRTRPLWMRAGAAGISVPLALGLYVTFSRGALAGVAVGLALIAVLARDRSQMRALALLVPAGVVAAAVGGVLDGVRALDGSLGTREREGAVMLAVLVVLSAGAVLGQVWLSRRERPGEAPFKPLGATGRRVVAAVLVVGVLGVFALAAGLSEPPRGPQRATAARLVSTQSARADYWAVALRAFGHHPLRGTGSGGFAVEWLRERTIASSVRDAHSLYVETAAELGLVGLLALALFLGGWAWGAVQAYARDPALAAGLIAGSAVWVLHAGLDWLWEMPAVTLPVLLLAAGLLRLAEPGQSPPVTGGASLSR